MEVYTFRSATQEDIPFLVSTIIEAEKSGTEVLSYSEVFGLSEEETRDHIANMFQEEIDGCEFSVSSFILAEKNGEIAGSAAAWLEGSEGVPSSVLKGNLLNYILPKACIERAAGFSSILRDLHIEYVDSSIQIGVVYVLAGNRGNGLGSLLLDEQIKRLTKNNSGVSAAYVQVFSNNHAAIKAYQRAGFNIHTIKESGNQEILKLLPSNKKIQLKKVLITAKPN